MVGCLSISMCVATAQTDRPNGWLRVTGVKLDQLRENKHGTNSLSEDKETFLFLLQDVVVILVSD